jgi:hypothetical protein
MKTTEEVLQAAKSPMLPESIAAQTGRSATDTHTAFGR